MNKVMSLGTLLSMVGFLIVTITGVDLVTSRTSLGLCLLGLGGVLSAWSVFSSSLHRDQAILSFLTCLGSSYFIWRALSGGPIGLALPELVLILISTAAYFGVLSSSHRGRAIFLIGLGIVCLGNLTFAFFQEFTNSAYFVWEESSGRKKAVTGIFGHYNPLAGFLNGSVFFFLTYGLLGKKLPWRILSGIIVVGAFVALLLSGSRGGWLSLLAGGSVWLLVVLTHLKQAKSKYFGLTLVLGMTLALLAISTAQWRLQKLTNERQAHLTESLIGEENFRVDDGGRLEFQQLAFEIFQDHPLIGAGPRAYSYLSLEYWDRERRPVRERPPEFAHNEYLQVLADYGVVGLVAAGGLIFLHLIFGVFRVIENNAPQQDLRIWQIGAVGGMIALLVQCFFSFLLHVPACVALLGLQAGFLALRSGDRENQSGRMTRGFSGFRAFYSICISVLLLSIGFILVKSYLLGREANRQISSVLNVESALKALETMRQAGHLGRDPEIFEVMGRLAMSYASEALQKNDPKMGEEFNRLAKIAFQGALRYNPHFAAGLAGLPRVEDALGNWELAEEGHELAMKKLWSREFKLRPHYYAAQSAYASALRSLYDGDRDRALLEFRKAQDRLNQRHDIMKMSSIRHKEKGLIAELAAWVDFMEAQVLFKKGDEIWKNTRPRNPELAYGLMLEAQKRFQACETVVKDKNPNWERLVKQLEFYLGVLEGGRVQPVQFTEEELAEILGREAVLDSRSTSR